MGRWWEDPRAGVAQHLGIGSLVYVFVLSLFLWLMIWPLTPRPGSYLNLLTVVTLTAPPGILYAVPVRHWFDLAFAQQLRLGFLAIVATWRVLLLGYYLAVGRGLSGVLTFMGTAFPLTVIIVALFALNLENAAFDLMRDIRPEEATVNDTAYGILFPLSLLSLALFALLLLPWGFLAIRKAWTAFATAHRRREA